MERKEEREQKPREGEAPLSQDVPQGIQRPAGHNAQGYDLSCQEPQQDCNRGPVCVRDDEEPEAGKGNCRCQVLRVQEATGVQVWVVWFRACSCSANISIIKAVFTLWAQEEGVIALRTRVCL